MTIDDRFYVRDEYRTPSKARNNPRWRVSLKCIACRWSRAKNKSRYAVLLDWARGHVCERNGGRATVPSASAGRGKESAPSVPLQSKTPE